MGVAEAKRSKHGANITATEGQTARYANSKFKWVKGSHAVRFAYEVTDELTRFTDYRDIKYCSRSVFTFHRPETLQALINAHDTIRNHMKRFPAFDTTGFRDCQIRAINKLDQSFADNKPRALVQMATGAGKTFTAITAVYRLLKFGEMNRILFLVDTKSLGGTGGTGISSLYPERRSPAIFRYLRRIPLEILPNACKYADLHQYDPADVLHLKR